jgi:hypothetical protein
VTISWRRLRRSDAPSRSVPPQKIIECRERGDVSDAPVSNMSSKLLTTCRKLPAAADSAASQRGVGGSLWGHSEGWGADCLQLQESGSQQSPAAQDPVALQHVAGGFPLCFRRWFAQSTTRICVYSTILIALPRRSHNSGVGTDCVCR